MITYGRFRRGPGGWPTQMVRKFGPGVAPKCHSVNLEMLACNRFRVVPGVCEPKWFGNSDRASHQSATPRVYKMIAYGHFRVIRGLASLNGWEIQTGRRTKVPVRGFKNDCL
jgi:hypothetical protein